MIRCEVIKDFTLTKFNELKNIKRKKFDTKGKLYIGDTFECDEDMVKYLTGNNDEGEVVVKVIEVEPENKKYSFIIAEKLDDEHITPLRNKEELDELSKAIEKAIKPKKKKSSKK